MGTADGLSTIERGPETVKAVSGNSCPHQLKRDRVVLENFVAPRLKRGRPALEPTERITVRLPLTTLEVVHRRARKAGMAPSAWLARIIHHEAVRNHNGSHIIKGS